MGFLQEGWRLLRYAAGLYAATGCRQSAAALTYMTLFAIVPIMTVTYSVFSVIPSFQGLGDQLQQFIFSHFIPDSGQELGRYLKEFSQQARSLTLAGIGMLVVTAYLMLKNIEHVFNTIWGVSRGRQGLSNFLLYWAVLSLGPVLVGIGLAMTTYVLSIRFLTGDPDGLGIVQTLFAFTPFLLTCFAFTLLFAAVPNCRVPIRDAVIGGAITAVGFELLKYLFGVMVARSGIQVIYGAFAFVPLFLMWIYMLWMVVLGGAVLVRAISSYRLRRLGERFPDLVASLLALWALKQKQKSGDAVSDSAILRMGVGDQQWRRLREQLQQHHIIAVTSRGQYLLSRDLDQFSLRDLADFIKVPAHMPGVSEYLQTFDWFHDVAARLLSIDQHMERELDVPVGELFRHQSVVDEITELDDGLDELRQQLGSEDDEFVLDDELEIEEAFDDEDELEEARISDIEDNDVTDIDELYPKDSSAVDELPSKPESTESDSAAGPRTGTA